MVDEGALKEMKGTVVPTLGPGYTFTIGDQAKRLDGFSLNTPKAFNVL
jgi:hypothetical protein